MMYRKRCNPMELIKDQIVDDFMFGIAKYRQLYMYCSVCANDAIIEDISDNAIVITECVSLFDSNFIYKNNEKIQINNFIMKERDCDLPWIYLFFDPSQAIDYLIKNYSNNLEHQKYQKKVDQNESNIVCDDVVTKKIKNILPPHYEYPFEGLGKNWDNSCVACVVRFEVG